MTLKIEQVTASDLDELVAFSGGYEREALALYPAVPQPGEEALHFAARDGERIIGFIEATFEGENYLTVHPTMRNICGAGVLPEYRGRGVMRALLSVLAEKYRAEGITVLGVDYETQNPQARGFWESVFTPYTWSWERHFDRPWGPL